jgi:hypothetical protein
MILNGFLVFSDIFPSPSLRASAWPSRSARPLQDHYKDLGGDAAAHVAPKNDLQGVKVYNAVDLEGLFTLGTVVLEYRGYRVTAQSIIPGILEREADLEEYVHRWRSD